MGAWSLWNAGIVVLFWPDSVAGGGAVTGDFCPGVLCRRTTYLSPDQSSTKPNLNRDYVTAPLAIGAGITYFGSQGVASSAGGSIDHHVLLGINDLPTPLDVGPPDCAGDFALRLDNADYSAIADCVTFDGSIIIDTSASLDVNFFPCLCIQHQREGRGLLRAVRQVHYLHAFT